MLLKPRIEDQSSELQLWSHVQSTVTAFLWEKNAESYFPLTCIHTGENQELPVGKKKKRDQIISK